MDFGDIKRCNKRIELINPKTGAGLGVFFELCPMSDDRVKAAMRIGLDRLQGVTSIEERQKIDEENQFTTFAASIVSWQWGPGMTLKGQADPPCTEENKLFVLRSEGGWAAGQVLIAHGTASDFFSDSASA